MIDTNIFDKLIQDPFFPDIWDALEAKLLSFVTTRVQEEEISKIHDQRRKKLLQSIPRTVIPLALEPVTEPDKHRNDRLIAETAMHCCNMFVTEDKPLQEWCNSHCKDYHSYDYQEFLAWFLKEIFPALPES